MQWFLLNRELARWRAAGRTAVLWWRDDDARQPTAQLDRLLSIARAHDMPLTLAVVPDVPLQALGARLAEASGVTAVQHGYDHQNRRGGAHAGEIPHDWSADQIRAHLAPGWANLSTLPGARRIYVPPWNDVHPLLPGVLVADGYEGWSAWQDNGETGGLARVDAHLDLLRWRGGARFRGTGKFLKELRRMLVARRQAGRWDAPIGVLTHHLVHDENSWRFLYRFMGWTRARPAVEWRAMPALLPLA